MTTWGGGRADTRGIFPKGDRMGTDTTNVPYGSVYRKLYENSKFRTKDPGYLSGPLKRKMPRMVACHEMITSNGNIN